jgi:diguanylate cyclase
MLKDLIVNAALLVAFISIINQIFRNSGLNASLPVKHRILSGGIFGLLGITLMVFGVSLPSNMMLDFRNLAVFLSAVGGGCLSTAITALIISLCRLFFYGINKPSITAILVIVVLAIVFCAIVKLKVEKRYKWLFSIVISEIVSIIAFSILIKNSELLQEVILYYCISFTTISFILYYYVSYLDDLTESFRRYKQESNRDFLTGLNNVRQFDKLFNSKIENLTNSDEKIALLYIDIDFFKRVNDTYGHKDGDLVLKVLGEILIKACRSIDIVSRNGGEEFSVILANCSPTIATEIAERIRENVEKTSIELSDKTKINITVSVGVACYPEPVQDFKMLREKADMALYEAKRTGRNKVVLYK